MFGFLKKRNEKWVKARISLYLDGHLSVGEQAKMESHLKDCHACRDELASLQSTIEALRQLPLVEAPRSFIIPALKLSPQPVTFYRFRIATVAVSALLVAVIAGDSMGLFFRPESYQPLMAPAPAAMPTPQPPTATLAAAPTTTPAPVLAPAPQSTVEAVPKLAPIPMPTSTPNARAFQAQQTPVPSPAPSTTSAPVGKAAISSVPAPTPAETPPLPQKASPVVPAGPPGPRGLAGAGEAEATKAVLPSTPPAETLSTPKPSPAPPMPSQIQQQARAYWWPARQLEIVLASLVFILALATIFTWRKAKKKAL